MSKKPKKSRLKPYRVWIAQINQDYIDVEATDFEQARKRATRVWRRDNAIPEITSTMNLNEGTLETDRARTWT